jgi:plasmid maintenance system killer protein
VVILGLKVVLRRMKRQTLRSNSGCLSEIGTATFTHSLDLGLGQHCIRINDQWRICFRWQDGNAYDVEIIDYH